MNSDHWTRSDSQALWSRSFAEIYRIKREEYRASVDRWLADAMGMA